jgi:hypothetical protein
VGDGTRRLEIMDRQWAKEGRGSRRARQGVREEGAPKKKKKMGL